MMRKTVFALAALLAGALVVTADEAAPPKPDEASVVCDSCSARKKGLLKLKEAREAQNQTSAESAQLAEADKATDD